MIHSKLASAGLGTALATLIWTLLAAFVDQIPENLDAGQIATCTGTTAVIIGGVLGYWTGSTPPTDPPVG